MKTCKILIADDHPAVCRGVRSLLSTRTEWEICGEAHSGEEAVEQAQLLKPDVVILDISMPRMNGLEATRQIRSTSPEVSVLVLSMYDSKPMLRMAMEAGVSGYVLKSDLNEQLIEGVQALCEGRLFFSPGVTEAIVEMCNPDPEEASEGEAGNPDALTPRQLEVLQLLARGMTNKEVASTLGISTRTVEAHRYTIMNRLKLRSLSELVLYAVRNRIIEPDGPAGPF